MSVLFWLGDVQEYVAEFLELLLRMVIPTMKVSLYHCLEKWVPRFWIQYFCIAES